MNQPRYRVIRRKQKTRAIAPYRWISARASMAREFISDRHPLWWLWKSSAVSLGLYLFYLWVINFSTIFLILIGSYCGIGAICAAISLLQRLTEND